MIQNRRQAAKNARVAAANRTNSGRMRGGMRSATGQGATFQPPAGGFVSSRPLTKRAKAAIATTTLMPFL